MIATASLRRVRAQNRKAALSRARYCAPSCHLAMRQILGGHRHLRRVGPAAPKPAAPLGRIGGQEGKWLLLFLAAKTDSGCTANLKKLSLEPKITKCALSNPAIRKLLFSN